MNRTRVLILGAAGRDFHNFNVVFRNDFRYEVVAFTATQIPNIEERQYPPSLSGPFYPDGIPILSELDLNHIIQEQKIEQVVFAYSDVSHDEVMHKASQVIAKGADFRLLGAQATMIAAKKPVLSICGVRTGVGKSPASRKIADILTDESLRTVIVRHPMPYGDLSKQAVQRFASLADMDKADCTIEEMEEYEPHIKGGRVVYAGVDYEAILRRAEEEADVILWDGGNNDLPFFAPDLEIVLTDPHRSGDETRFFPGEANLLRADIILLTKIDTAPEQRIDALRNTIHTKNPSALIVDSTMPIMVDEPEKIQGARVLVVEDGPTLTHGGMSFGAGVLAAKKFGAAELIDPRSAAVGSIKKTFHQYPHIGSLLPAMGYGPEQIRELEETIEKVDCDLVLIATPADLRRVIQIRKPTSRVGYELQGIGHPTLPEVLKDFIWKAKQHA